MDYQYGFGNALASEARPGALPPKQNIPRKAPFGLYPECLNGTGFTVERAQNRRVWMYRLRPSIHHRPWEPVAHPRLVGRFDDVAASPQVRRWRPLPLPEQATDWLAGLATFGGAGDPAAKAGAACHLYAANADMQGVFANTDGDLAIFPQHGRLHVQTELGWLHAAPGEMVLIPRGLRFRVLLPDGVGRGIVGEVFDGHLALPEHGLIGPNGLADPRHFAAPVAAYEDRATDTEITVKQGGQLWRTVAPHSPFDVVAWHGRYAPFKYDLMDFASFGSVSWDHPDPSILTVMTCPADDHGRGALDIAVFRGRWDPTEHTFRPPYFHRNSAIEFNGVIRSPSAEGPYPPGAFSFTPYLTPHGVSPASYEAAIGGADPAPHRMSDDSLWMQFESTYLWGLTPWAMSLECEDTSLLAGFHGYPEPKPGT